MTSDPETLYASLHQFASFDALSVAENVPHPYGLSSTAVTELRNLITAAEHASASLTTYLSQPWSDPKLPFSLRQRALVSAPLLRTEAGVKHVVDTLIQHAATHQYGLDSPEDANEMIGWCLERLESWGVVAGMEVFRDEEQDGKLTLILGGKMLVLDVDLMFDRKNPVKPSLSLLAVRSSYALSGGADHGGSQTGPGSASMAGLIADGIRAFLLAVQAPKDKRDALWAAKLDGRIRESLAYMMRLDRLAVGEGEGGLRWFTALDELAAATEAFAASEARLVASAQSLTQTPLDIFLSCGHALPLPYLLSPSLSFLTYLSPLAYLSLVRTSPSNPLSSAPKLPVLDIPFPSLRGALVASKPPPGVTLATLLLVPYTHTILPALDMGPSMPSTRPRFMSGIHGGANADFTLPPAPMGQAWVLDFADSSPAKGVIMSQSRMQEIQSILDPTGSSDFLSAISLPNITGTIGSWVDLLVNPGKVNMLSPDYYTATYRSPSSLYPPLKLRLQAPREPGFLLERVPVRTLREVWAILEVVKEQCWLNEILLTCTWSPEVPGAPPEHQADDEAATEDELHALLAGTYTPRSIPVSVALSPPASQNPLIESTLSPPNTHIRLTAPGRGPVPGRTDIIVSHDFSAPCGCRVEVGGGVMAGLGVDVDTDTLEEVVRRGGALSIPGRVWISGGMK